ncbi:acylphosphatase [Weissella halotolerans]
MMQRTVEIRVNGHVQGVGFRYATKMIADRLSLVGEVYNAVDGSVHIIASGPANIIAEFIKQVQSSPSPYGRVDELTVENLSHPLSNTTFSIK